MDKHTQPHSEINDDDFLASLNDLLASTPATIPQSAPPSEKAPAHSSDSRRKMAAVLLCAAAVLLLAAGGFFGWRALRDPYGGKIIENVSICGVDVGGMSKSAAKRALKAAFGDSYSQTTMEVCLPDTTISLSPKDTGAQLNISRAVKAAFALGRSEEAPDTGVDLGLLPYLKLNQDVIHNALDAYAAGFESVYVPSGYTLEGVMPSLEPGEFDASAPCQTLVLTMGTPGFSLDTDKIFQDILTAYDRHSFSVTVNQKNAESIPEKLNLEAIYSELRIDPVEPYVDLETLQVVPGIHGYDFNAEEAQKLADSAAYGDILQIPMEYVAPEIADEDAFFQDVLGYCETPHGTNENRTENLRIACAALDGLVLQPGEEFSYNDTLGERTADKGYKPAPAYSGTRLVDSLGGGICQVSSTLYLASVYAELTILERVNHGYPVSYIPLGMDATVNWGFTDLKMRNDSELPVKFAAEESDGYVRISVLGTETRDYDIKMTYSVGGRHVRTYKSKYDKATGELISKEPFALSSYLESIYGDE